MRSHIGGLADDESRDGKGEVDSETRASASSSGDAVRNGNTNDLAAEEGKLVEPEGDLTNLARDVLHAIDGGRGDALGPDNENESNVVGPQVDGVEQRVAKLGAVRQCQQKRQHRQGGDDHRP